MKDTDPNAREAWWREQQTDLTREESLALDLQRVARALDALRAKLVPGLRTDRGDDAEVRLSHVFSLLYGLAHDLAPALVLETPHWLGGDT